MLPQEAEAALQAKLEQDRKAKEQQKAEEAEQARKVNIKLDLQCITCL